MTWTRPPPPSLKESLQWRHNEHDGVSNHQPHVFFFPNDYSGANQRKHQSSASLVFVRWIYQSPLKSTQEGLVTRKMSPFENVIVAVMRGFEILFYFVVVWTSCWRIKASVNYYLHKAINSFIFWQEMPHDKQKWKFDIEWVWKGYILTTKLQNNSWSHKETDDFRIVGLCEWNSLKLWCFVSLNKLLNKHSQFRQLETPWSSCGVTVMPTHPWGLFC